MIVKSGFFVPDDVANLTICATQETCRPVRLYPQNLWTTFCIKQHSAFISDI